MAYLVRHLSDGGEILQSVCRGRTLQDAVAAAGVRRNRMISAKWTFVVPDWLDRIPLKEQELILMRLQPLISGGRAAEVAAQLPEFAAARRRLRKKPHLLDDGLALSERLSGLGFDPGVVTLIRAGEEAGFVVEHLRGAISHLEETIKLSRQTTRGVYMGLGLMGVSLAVLLIVAASLRTPLQSLQELQSLALDFNLLTEVLLFFGWLVTEAGWFLLAFAAGAGYAAWRFWESLSRWWPLSYFRDLSNTARSLRLARIWGSLNRTGLPIEQHHDLIEAAAGRRAAAAIRAGLAAGLTFSELLVPRWFSPTLQAGCRAIGEISVRDFGERLEQLTTLLTSEKEVLARRAAGLFHVAGICIMLAVLILLLGGVLWPIYTSAGVAP